MFDLLRGLCYNAFVYGARRQNQACLLKGRCIMNNKMGETRHFRLSTEAPESAEEIIEVVYQALKAKGHDPIMQLVGYIISGDPTYITSYNNARSLIRRLERDEILEEFVRFYIPEHDKP